MPKTKRATALCTTIAAPANAMMAHVASPINDPNSTNSAGRNPRARPSTDRFGGDDSGWSAKSNPQH